jgi:hypothetical protein
MMVTNLWHFEECTTFITSEINNPATKHNPEDLNPQDTGDYMHFVGEYSDQETKNSSEHIFNITVKHHH